MGKKLKIKVCPSMVVEITQIEPKRNKMKKI
jgi:hypothetical protein